MNKGPPVGNIIRRQVSLLPKYCLTTTTVDEKTVQVKLSLTNHAHLSENIDNLTAGGNHKSYIVAGDTENYLLYLNSFKETDLINLYDGCITFQITRKHSTEHEILVHCISSTFVGIDEHCKYSFKDINPFSKSNIQVDSNLLDKTPRNVNADDTFKERKRKTKDTTAIHCNEKKKRDLKFVEKFYNLKDLLGQTSKNIKLDINKTTEMSNKILENLELEQHTNNNITNKELEVIENLNDSFENIFAEDFHDDEIVDDDKVSDILKEIENEIKVDKTTVLDTEQITNYKTLPSAIQKKYSLSTYNAKRKAITPKNNFNFIDKLDTKSNNDNINNTDICKETGFNNAIKGHIEKYLQEAHDSNSTKIDLTNLVEPEKYHKDVDVHKVYTKKTPEESRSIEKNQINNADMKQMQLEKNGSEVKNDDKIQISPPHSIQSGIVDLPTHTNIFNSIEADQNNLKIVSSNSFNKNEMIGLQTSAICSGSNNIIVVDNKFEGNIDDEHTFIGYPINLQNNNKKLHEEKHNFKNISNFENITSHDAEVYKQETNQIIPINDPEYGRSHTNNTNENLEYIRKHKASRTQLFNITSENSKQKVQIIGKLKIDLDVTEIVHNNESHTTIDTDNDKNNIKSISHIPCISTSHDKNTLGRVDVERRILKIVEPDQQINENLKKTSDLTEYKKHNNNFPPNNDEPIKESLCIKDILQKYNNDARRSNKENEENTYTSKVQVNAQNEIKDATQITKINRRKLRIADIDKIHIDLPASLIGASQSSSNNYSNTESIEIEEQSDLSQNNKHIETYNNIDINIFDKINFNNNSNNVINKDKEIVVLNQNNEHLQIHTNNIKLMNESNIIDDISLINDADLPSPDLTSELTDDNFEFDINAILNPKALLETMHTEDEVIPPPLQFSDNNTYSSVHLSQEQTNLAYFTEYGEVTEDFEINESVFPENTDIELTPTEFETRSPSHVVSSPDSSPGHSFTMMRKSLNENTNTLVYPNSRRAKLSHFKFKRKSMLRK